METIIFFLGLIFFMLWDEIEKKIKELINFDDNNTFHFLLDVIFSIGFIFIIIVLIVSLYMQLMSISKFL